MEAILQVLVVLFFADHQYPIYKYNALQVTHAMEFDLHILSFTHYIVYDSIAHHK